MVDYEKKFGSISSKEIDKSKIYATAANAAQGLKNVKISDHNASWNSENLTYEIKDNGVVMIKNNNVPIGFTNLADLKTEMQDTPNTSGPAVPSEEAPADVSTKYEESDVPAQNLRNQGYSNSMDGNGLGQISNLESVTHDKKMDSYMEENVEEIVTGTITRDDSIDATYDDSTGSIVDEATSESPVPTETSDSGDQVIDAKLEDDSAAEEIKEEHNEPITPAESDSGEHLAAAYDEDTEVLAEETKSGVLPSEEAPDQNISSDYEPTEEEMYNQEAKDFSVDRNLDEIAAEVEAMGGNLGHSIYDDAKRSGNEEAYMENMNNMLDNLESVQAQFDADGYGYSFQSTCFSGGTHATSNNSPAHFMGAKADLKWFKNGVQLDVGNATKEDWQYIKSVLQDNGLDVQFEKGNTVWGDTFLQQALNQNGEYVSYEGKNWGKGIDIHYTK